MDIYDETYEVIMKKIEKVENSAKAHDDELDMYADDFDSKEKNKLGKEDGAMEEDPKTEEPEKSSVLMWEYKDTMEDEKIHGPFTSQQMLNYVNDGKIHKGAVARKVGDENSKFYSLARIDFDLYI
jgi:CD2 antigen cytoplasmic tail-binding protein 2